MKNLLLLLSLLSIICFSCLQDIDEIEQVTSPFDPEYDTPLIDIENIVIRDTIINQNGRCYAKIYFKFNETSYNRMNALSGTEARRLVVRNHSNQQLIQDIIDFNDVELGKTYVYIPLHKPCFTEVCKEFLYILTEDNHNSPEHKTTAQSLDCFFLEP